MFQQLQNKGREDQDSTVESDRCDQTLEVKGAPSAVPSHGMDLQMPWILDDQTIKGPQMLSKGGWGTRESFHIKSLAPDKPCWRYERGERDARGMKMKVDLSAIMVTAYNNWAPDFLEALSGLSGSVSSHTTPLLDTEPHQNLQLCRFRVCYCRQCN